MLLLGCDGGWASGVASLGSQERNLERRRALAQVRYSACCSGFRAWEMRGRGWDDIVVSKGRYVLCEFYNLWMMNIYFGI